ncbi:MAG: YfiR family protein [Candidatus Thiodiazotropha sp. (ex Lucinoma borealis)]|nr:YfiR family protein [Candidatus Thiodiazotropha sp. (ex Lucinoma borealis)]
MSITQTASRVRMRSFFRTLTLFALLYLLPSDYAHAESATEHELKAVFLYNFANYITWPESAFQNQDSPFNYCLLGRSRINDSLNAVIKNETIKGRHLRLVEFQHPTQLSECHILFIHQLDEGYPPDLLRQLAAESILTVGDDANFIPAGGAIGLLQKARKIDLVISMDAVELARLKVSSKLLRLAKRVRPSSELSEK